MKLEGVLLTGGASRRMGEDKASMIVGGETMGVRMARLLGEVCERVTVLGREPIEGCEFSADKEEFAGPLVTLSAFYPQAARVFVLSCDLPLMTSHALNSLARAEGTVVPVVGGRRQPLCALYSAPDFDVARVVVSEDGRSMMAWLERLEIRALTPAEIGVDEAVFTNVNTPDEWQKVTLRESI